MLKKPFLFILYRFKERFSPRSGGLYHYRDYEDYRKAQIEGNIKKIDRLWVSEENIRQLSEYLKKEVPSLKFGICHGTRRGKEQEWFRKYLGIEVIGTEISPTASQFPHTIEWDFHDVKEEWVGATDFIYSNSFDHSYKPEACLDAWMSCLKKGGVCILEWSNGHTEPTKLDPFGGSIEDYKKLIGKKYFLRDILKASDNRWYKNKRSYFLIIGHADPLRKI